jgi:hypothetical protein
MVKVCVIVKVGVMVEVFVNVGETENVGEMVGDSVTVLVIVMVGESVAVPCGPAAVMVFVFLQPTQDRTRTINKTKNIFPFMDILLKISFHKPVIFPPIILYYNGNLSSFR